MSAGCGACAGRFGTGVRTLCVRDVADLESLLKKRPTFDSIRIMAPLSSDERLHWERRLFALYDECGCTMGAVALLCVLAASGVYALLQPAQLGWQAIAMVLLMCFVAVIAGKFIGIMLSRRRLRAAVRLLGETLARIRQMDGARRTKGHGNAGETVDSFFHPSGPTEFSYLIQRKSLICRPKLARGAGRAPFHPVNPGLDRA